MLGFNFYFGLIRKYVVLFGTVFNDLQIVRFDETHNVSSTIDIPLTYGPREKVLARLQQDPGLDRKPAIQLPRMSFELMNYQYDAARKLHSTGRQVTMAADSSVQFQYVPVPYNFDFTLSIMTKNIDDQWRIVEQILPFFTPDFALKVNLIPETGEIRDAPIMLNSTNFTDIYTDNFEERRVIISELGFTMKGWLYGPIRTADLILQANTNFFDASAFDDMNDAVGSAGRVETKTVVPGQTANGQPTSNAAASIDKTLISANSDYGYVITSNTNFE